MSHVVYMVTFHRSQLPNKYIGSKSNAKIIDGKIMKNRREVYVGSSSCKLFLEAKETCQFTVEILGVFDEYEDALEAEHNAHVRYDVVAAPEYFNKSIAKVNNYTNPNYATYRHVETGKVARLPRQHPRVLNGEWVGVTKGHRLTEKHRRNIGNSERGEKNGFYGRRHTEESKRKSGKKIGDAHRGKPKSAEHRRAMSEAAKRLWATRKENKARGQKEGI